MADQVLRLIITGNTSNATAAMRKFQRDLRAVERNLTAVGQSLTMGFTLPLAAIGAVSVRNFAMFEKSLNKVRAATGATATEMDQLSDLAKKLGQDTVFSAGEAADAMLELAKSGITPAEISAGALQATLELAAAGELDLASAATTAANAMNTFGLSAEDMGRVADALAGGATASSASVESLQLALQQAGSVASNMGVSLEETVAVLAAFADKGVQGSDAGTSFKTMLMRLIPTTSEAAKAMEAYGLTFVDSQGNIDDMATVAEKLRTTLGPLSEAERQRALTTIFGSDATRAATVLMQAGADGVREYTKATSDRTAAETMAAAGMEGLAGALEQLSGSLETASIVIGEALAPTVEDLSVAIKDAVDWFSGLDEETREGIVQFGLFVGATGPVILALGKVAGAIKAVHKGYMILNSAAIAANLTTWAAVSAEAAAALSLLASGSSVTAVVGLGAAAGATALATSALAAAVAGVGGYLATTWILEVTGATEVLEDWGAALGDAWAKSQGFGDDAASIREAYLNAMPVERAEAWRKALASGDAQWRTTAKGAVYLTGAVNDSAIAIKDQSAAAKNSAGAAGAAKGATGDLAAAQDALAAATQQLVRDLNGELVALGDLGAIERTAAEADIANQQAKLDLKDAQKAYNDAVAKGGKNSDEAKRAKLRLREAELRAKDAAVDYRTALEDLDGAQAAAKARAAEFARKLDAIRVSANQAADALESMYGKGAGAATRAAGSYGGPINRASGAIEAARSGGVLVRVAEAGDDEAIIPINSRPRSHSLLATAARRMGYELVRRMAEGGIVSATSFRPIYELQHLQGEASSASSAAASALDSAKAALAEAKANLKAAKGAKELAKAKRELAAATRAYAKASADASKKALAEANALIAVARAQRAQIVADAEQALAENDARLSEQTSALNKRLAADIEGLWTRYEDAIASRVEAIRDAFGGLFGAAPKKKAEEYKAAIDEVTAAEAALTKMRGDAMTLETDYVAAQDRLIKAQEAAATAEKERSGQGMLERLREQAAALKEWTAGLGTLSASGLSETVVSQLRASGPGNIEEIRSMMNLSSAELAEVSALWAEMGTTATGAATTELEPMRLSTLAEIDQLKTDAAIELQGYVEEWRVAHETIVADAQAELAQLRFETTEAIKDIENLSARARASSIAASEGLTWDHQPGAGSSALTNNPAPIDLKVVLDLGGAIAEQVVRITSDMVRTGVVTARMGVA